MLLNHRDKSIYILGDTHLDRRFVSNVPLHRRGERERMVWDQFVRELDPQRCEYHIHMGDLFDKPVVSLSMILKTATAYLSAAKAHPNTKFRILRGNHDCTDGTRGL